ncbi:MAG: glycine dehydrogenase, partial [Alloprevotella sp.]
MKYLPHTPSDLEEMLRVIGVQSLDELYAEVPEELKLKRELNIPAAMSEIEVRRELHALAGRN